jgi:site-specific DNA recombinase
VRQEAVGVRSAAAQGLGLPVQFIDDGYSGAMLERPGLDRLRDAVATCEVDAILCLCPDRLSRNFLHLGILVEELRKHGARVVFLNQPAEDTPENRLLVQIQGAVSEYERTKILDRTRRGRQPVARAPGRCHPPKR